MPPRSEEEKARRKAAAEEKKIARQEAKAQKEREEVKAKAALAKLEEGKIPTEDIDDNSDKTCYFLTLSDDVQNHVLCFLSARDLGAVSMTCRSVNFGMGEIRVSHLLSRLNTHATVDQIGKLSVPIRFCENDTEARQLLKLALDGSGETGRLVTKKSKKGKKNNAGDADEYIAYARFLEEAVQGHAIQKFPGKNPSELVSFLHVILF